MNNINGYVFNIQRFSIHDGPGIRTTVFLKGCPLHCFWCHNPEGIRPKPEVQFYPSRCILCGDCVVVCEEHAHEIRDGIHLYDRSRCVNCGRCVEACCAVALELSGRLMTVDQVTAEVLQDRPFYETSGGGVTLSGGEPLLQRDFTREILARCKEEGVHTAIETTASGRWEDIALLLPVTDMVMMDIKHMDAEKHRAATGVSNRRILENARKLAGTDKPIIFHTPVVPTINDSPEEIGAIAHFIKGLIDLRQDGSNNGSLASISLELLPFHRLAGDKYKSLGLDYRARDLEMPGKEKMSALVEVAKQYEIPVSSR